MVWPVSCVPFGPEPVTTRAIVGNGSTTPLFEKSRMKSARRRPITAGHPDFVSPEPKQLTIFRCPLTTRGKDKPFAANPTAQCGSGVARCMTATPLQHRLLHDQRLADCC